MNNFFEKTSNRALFIFLVLSYSAFYAVQIPLVTSNPDIMVFSCRSLAPAPIVRYAYLDERYHLGQASLPNYHLGHTVVLWLAYHLFPSDLAHTIWPAGLVSAICGGFIAGITFLIALRLRFTRTAACAIAIINGLIPNLWNMSTGGELYALQCLAALVFLYGLLGGRMVLATVGFLCAALVSPIGGLSISLAFLAPHTQRTLVKTITCAATALAVYVLIFYLLKVNVLGAFSAISVGHDRSLIIRVLILVVFLIINIGFLAPFLVRGFGMVRSKYPGLSLSLCLVIAPWVALAILDSQFSNSNDGFLLLIFWALCLPIGLAFIEAPIQNHWKFLSLLSVVCCYIVVWILPDISRGQAWVNAGNELRTLVPEPIKIAGEWNGSVPITFAKYGWDFEQIQGHYFCIDPRTSGDSLLLKTGERSLLVVFTKKDRFHQKLTKLKIPFLIQDKFDPGTISRSGAVRKILENEAIIVYRWDRYGPDKKS